jgi:hypothetical protein
MPRPVLAAALALAATSALAQASPSNDPGPQGFFSTQPQSDPSLFRTLPPEAYPSAEPSSAAAATPGDAAAASPNAAGTQRPVVVVVPEAGNGLQEQFDRAQVEAQQTQANRAPAPINGAFTGNTDPDNR